MVYRINVIRLNIQFMFLKSCFIAIFSHYFHGTSVLYCHFLSFSSFIIITYPEIHILNMSPSPISTFPCVSFISLLCSIFCCPCICPVDTNLLYAAPLPFPWNLPHLPSPCVHLHTILPTSFMYQTTFCCKPLHP